MQPFAGDEPRPFGLEAGGETRVLLLHGCMGTSTGLRPLGRSLAEAGISARAAILPGFGPNVSRLGDWRVATLPVVKHLVDGVSRFAAEVEP